MKKVHVYYIAAILLALNFSSCSDFLDKIPDTRVELNTPEQLRLLLVNGYSTANISLVGEMSSDNMIDNNSPDENGNRYNLSSADRMDDELFAWEDVVSSIGANSPSSVWEGCYRAIAVANAVLDRIPYFEEQGRGQEVQAHKGEALLIRAYNHFVLANIFCLQYRGEELSQSIVGIPYITAPETTVFVHYERKNLAEVYKLIEADLLAGLPLIDDALYEIPKYHFNKKAANAFAARFYLFKREYDKVVKYADAALGTSGDASGMMRTLWGTTYVSYGAIIYAYISPESINNFLLVPTYSLFMRRFGERRYTNNRDAADATLFGSGPTWSNYTYHPCYSGKLFLLGGQEYGVVFPKNGELFEYTDKIGGIGYAHEVRCEFTAEETLLCRAEAKLFLRDIDGAVADLKTWDDARQKTTTVNSMPDLTKNLITNFYVSSRSAIVKPVNTDLVCPSTLYRVTDEMMPFLQCVLHYRRLETIYDGFRWFDIKRHGIEITHKIGRDRIETLTWNDPRRALQIPTEVISAGLEPNLRVPKGTQNPIQVENAQLVTE